MADSSDDAGKARYRALLARAGLTPPVAEVEAFYAGYLAIEAFRRAIWRDTKETSHSALIFLPPPSKT